MKRLRIIVLITFYLINFNHQVFGYDEKYTHPQITNKAINQSNLNTYLIRYLNNNDGIKTLYGSKNIVKLIESGSTNEDASLKRSENHFWNPLKNEGLDDWSFGLHFTGYSNRDWTLGYDIGNGNPIFACDSGDNFDSSTCNDYSWRKARAEFYQAMTSTTRESRDDNFIKMYESLGRVIHLLEDMGVPAHTRNDLKSHSNYTEFHITDPGFPLGNLYEFYVQRRAREPNSTYISEVGENVEIPAFQSPPEFWSKDSYQGTNPDITVAYNEAGLAEYSNANFISRNAIFTESLPSGDKHYFPFPRESSLSLPVPKEVPAEDGKVGKILYFDKDKDGVIMSDFVGASYFWDCYKGGQDADRRAFQLLCYFMDDEIHENYAQMLIPKTIGYAAGLINCFFRGTLEISLPEDGLYAFRETEPNASEAKVKGFNKVRLLVKNTTSTGEQLLGGEVDLVVQYRFLMDREFYGDDPLPYAKNPLSNDAYTGLPGGMTKFHFSEPQYIAKAYTGPNTVTDIPTLLEFDLSDKEIPLWAVDVQLYVVYKGKLGKDVNNAENGAVCVGFKDVSEPTPLAFVNSHDIFCYNGAWWYDLDDSAKLKSFKDANTDNSCISSMTVNDLLHLEIKFSSKDAAGSITKGTVEKIPPGQFKRMYYLTDYDAVVHYSSPSYSTGNKSLSGIGLRNGFVQENGVLVWKYPGFSLYRGTEQWAWSIFVHACAGCLAGENCPACDEEAIDEEKIIEPCICPLISPIP